MTDINEIIKTVNEMGNDNMLYAHHDYPKVRLDRCILKDPRGNIRIYDWVKTYDDLGRLRTDVCTKARDYGTRLKYTLALEDELAGFDFF